MNNILRKAVEYLSLISITGLMMFFVLKLSLGKFSDLTEINKSIKSVEKITNTLKEDQDSILIKIHNLEKTQDVLVKGIQKNNNLLKSNNSELTKLRRQYWSLSKSRYVSQPTSRVTTSPKPKKVSPPVSSRYSKKPGIEFLDSVFYKRLKADK